MIKLENINAAADVIRQRIGDIRPQVGIVLGSGLGKLADTIRNPIVIPYSDLPYFPVSTAIGHKGNYIVGDLMIIKDHINLLPNPLIGPNIDEFGPRFPDMTRPYDPSIIRLAEKIAEEEGISLRKGVYVGCSGPSYETPAEYRYFRAIGADAVGMSTVPEVIVARHSSIPVFGMSVITDVAHATDDEEYVTDGEAIVKAADAAADRMTLLFRRIIEAL